MRYYNFYPPTSPIQAPRAKYYSLKTIKSCNKQINKGNKIVTIRTITLQYLNTSLIKSRHVSRLQVIDIGILSKLYFKKEIKKEAVRWPHLRLILNHSETWVSWCSVQQENLILTITYRSNTFLTFCTKIITSKEV